MRRRLFLASCAAAALIAGCTPAGDAGKTGADSAAKPGQKTFAMIPKGLTHVFWQTVHAGGDRGGKEFGYNIKWDGAQKESDTSGQIAVVENAIAAKVDGILLAPLDKSALSNVIKKAKEANIPVVLFDSAADVPEDSYVSFTATDNRKGGELAAERLIKSGVTSGKVGMIMMAANAASVNDRENGFEEYLKKNAPGIKIVKSNFGMSDRAKSQQVTEDLLTKDPDVVAIYAPAEPTIVGAFQAVKNRNLLGKIKLIGFDITPQLDEAVVKGEIDALVLQNPENMGYSAVKAMHEHLTGKSPAKSIDTGSVVMTKENAETPEVKALRPAAK
jgi:ribose transport system substrate-binding protein